MATDATYPGGGSGITSPNSSGVVHKGPADKFIPEIWSDEIIAEYQKNLKMAPLVKRMSMTGKKGDLIHVPKPIRGNASAKVESTAVTIQADYEEELTITIDRHFEYSRLIEDIVEVQALSSLRRFYTEDAGYQLALRVDTDLINAGTGFGDGTRTLAPTVDGASWINSNSYYAANAADITAYAADTVLPADQIEDNHIRGLIKLMDDNNVPMDNRVLVIPPAARKQIMGIDRYVSSDFVGGRGVESGLIGNLYGVDVYVSSNCPVVETAAENTAVGATADARGCLFFHKDAIVMAEQMAVRSQTQYKQEYLSTLYTADTLYGLETYRPESGFVLVVADA